MLLGQRVLGAKNFRSLPANDAIRTHSCIAATSSTNWCAIAPISSSSPGSARRTGTSPPPAIIANNFPLWGAMGAAAMMGLGLALAQPKRKVLVITGDGEMLMSLGALATIAVERPPNLTMAVLDNERYGETGMQKTHTACRRRPRRHRRSPRAPDSRTCARRPR